MSIELNSEWTIHESIARLYAYYGKKIVNSDSDIIYINDHVILNGENIHICIYDYKKRDLCISIVDNMDSSNGIDSPAISINSNLFAYSDIVDNAFDEHICSELNSREQSAIQSAIQSAYNSVEQSFLNTKCSNSISTPCSTPYLNKNDYDFNKIDIDYVIRRLVKYLNKGDPLAADKHYKLIEIRNIILSRLSSVEPKQFIIYKNILLNKYEICDKISDILGRQSIYNFMFIIYQWMQNLNNFKTPKKIPTFLYKATEYRNLEFTKYLCEN
jgi:hypothetical protein